MVGGGRGGMGDRFRDVRPKWVNPCGGILDDSGVDPDAPPLEDSEIAANAVLDVDIALSQIESFKDEFVSGLSLEFVLEGCCNNHFLILFGAPDVVNIPPPHSLWAIPSSSLLGLLEAPNSFAMSHDFRRLEGKKKGVMKQQ